MEESLPINDHLPIDIYIDNGSGNKPSVKIPKWIINLIQTKAAASVGAFLLGLIPGIKRFTDRGDQTEIKLSEILRTMREWSESDD